MGSRAVSRVNLEDEMAGEDTAGCEVRERLEQERGILFKAWMSWHSSNNAANGYPSASQLRKRRLEQAQGRVDEKDAEIFRHIEGCAACLEARRDSKKWGMSILFRVFVWLGFGLKMVIECTVPGFQGAGAGVATKR